MTKEKAILDMASFRKVDGTKINDVAEYIKSFVEDSNEEIRLYIGTDSQSTRRRNLTTYAIVICMHRITRDTDGNIDGGRGAHLIFTKVKRTDVKDRFNRLWWEIEYSMFVANFLKDKNVYLTDKKLSIHIDFSTNVEHGSNNAYNAAKGYVQSMGYQYAAKPNAFVASYAADMLARS